MLDRLAYRTVMFAFPIWTFGIIAGAIWADQAWGRYWGWDPTETWAFITWVVYACFLHARSTAGWRGRKAQIIQLAGFGCLIFNMVGVSLFVTGLHSYAGLNYRCRAALRLSAVSRFPDVPDHPVEVEQELGIVVGSGGRRLSGCVARPRPCLVRAASAIQSWRARPAGCRRSAASASSPTGSIRLPVQPGSVSRGPGPVATGRR